jgi:hypothetical protein
VSLIVIGCTALGFDSSAGDMGASVFGVFLIMLSAFLYSVYQVAYAKWIQNAVVRPDQTLGWIGMMGLSLILSSPLALAAGAFCAVLLKCHTVGCERTLSVTQMSHKCHTNFRVGQDDGDLPYTLLLTRASCRCVLCSVTQKSHSRLWMHA